MAHINLIAWDNGRGLSHDIRLLRQALESLGHQVSLTSAAARRRANAGRAWRAWLGLTWRWMRSGGREPRRYDASITLEHVHPGYFKLAHRNLFIPNPEWLSRRDQRQLHRFDAVLTKTQVATEIFRERGLRTLHIGFQSIDCRVEDVPPREGFLHLAGASRMKGTERLLALWRKHPEWPPLLALQSPGSTEATTLHNPPNLQHRVEYLPSIDDIRHLQNSYTFHLCLSETEGWGHYLVEAMSCGAVVLTCDAPPMNEFVQPDRGILVEAHPTEPLNAAMRYAFDDAALERAVEQAAAMTATERTKLSARARAWYEQNQAEFAANLDKALREVLPAVAFR